MSLRDPDRIYVDEINRFAISAKVIPLEIMAFTCDSFVSSVFFRDTLVFLTFVLLWISGERS
jgi:hypothetical protein